MEHTLPDVPLECLQAILAVLIQQKDPDATFVYPEARRDPPPEPTTLGKD